MKKVSSFVLILLLCSFWVAFLNNQSVKADPKTIVVPDDYSKIADAIGNATEGDTIFVKKGYYDEYSLDINKTISLIGEDANSTTLTNIDDPEWDFSFPEPTTIALQINANNVKLSGFTISSSSIAILVTGNNAEISDNILVDNPSGMSISGNSCAIFQNAILETEKYIIRCSGSYNNITGNRIVGTSLEGICIEGNYNVIHQNTILGDDWYGIKIRLNVNHNTISENNITGCTAIFIERGSNNVVYRNRITNGNTAIKLYKGDSNSFYANYIANNNGGALVGGFNVELNDNRFYHNDFINNTIQVSTEYPVMGINYFDDGTEGNYWSNYNGTDSNGDGIGDTPYIIDENRQDNYPFINPIDTKTIPEFPSWSPLLILVTVLTAVIAVYRHNLKKIIEN